jgi:hypothetical protein
MEYLIMALGLPGASPNLDLTRLRLLALRYHIRSDGTLRPVADVAYDLRTLHGVELTTRQVFELLSRKPDKWLLSSLVRR